MIGGVAALVAILCARGDVLILRKWPQRLIGAAGEAWIGRTDTGRHRGRRAERTGEHGDRRRAPQLPDEAIEEGCVQLIHAQDAGLQMGADVGVVADFENGIGGDLALRRQGPEQ